jgi:hypothetical protein
LLKPRKINAEKSNRKAHKKAEAESLAENRKKREPFFADFRRLRSRQIFNEKRRSKNEQKFIRNLFGGSNVDGVWTWMFWRRRREFQFWRRTDEK